MLRACSRFGSDVSFVPASLRGFLSAFTSDPMASKLTKRIDAARHATR